MSKKKPNPPPAPPKVAVLMGTKADWETMQLASDTLKKLDVPHECLIVSAHRTPQLMADYAKSAEERGLQVIIAGGSGAAHLPGMIAAHTLLPVFGVPLESHALKGMDSLLSIAQMPAGVPVGTLAIGKAGAMNAALLAVAQLARHDPELRERWAAFRREQDERVRAEKIGPSSRASTFGAPPATTTAREADAS
ncbi:MAG: 5-(carboxyamino)imidazole ribonucleotide mutase [Planctomycetes bacterium]|nr:5-(carboxyamino)imidazole ribonucleotide mutase [Planctomycetota bacterium]